jgi:hypothetical protein
VNNVSKRIRCVRKALGSHCLYWSDFNFNSLIRGTLPDWNGTWKLNTAKGDIPGPPIVVSISPDGMWHNTSHGGPPPNFRCGDKEYQQDSLTISCRQVDK